VNEPAPKIVFNYDLFNNHYIPTWAANIDGLLPGSAFVSLCSTKNMTNFPKEKPTSALNFISDRDITHDDFQRLLSVGLYIVIPNLHVEVSKYLECTENQLQKSIRIRRALHSRGFTSDVDLNGLCNSSTKNLFGTVFQTSNQSTLSVLMKILINVKIDGKAAWTDKFFLGKLKGFLLLLPRSGCGTFCAVSAFIYIDFDGRVKCCMMDEAGYPSTTF
jgi:hypothetical protein